jgi:hypothetical protein
MDAFQRFLRQRRLPPRRIRSQRASLTITVLFPPMSFLFSLPVCRTAADLSICA